MSMKIGNDQFKNASMTESIMRLCALRFQVLKSA